MGTFMTKMIRFIIEFVRFLKGTRDDEIETFVLDTIEGAFLAAFR